MGGRGSGGGKNTAKRGAIKGAGDAGVQRAQAVTVTEEQRAANRAAIDSINSKARSQTKIVSDGKTGESLRVNVEKVTTRDYWGRSTGEKTYTVRINKESNFESVYYNYGMKGLKGIKTEIKQYTHNS